MALNIFPRILAPKAFKARRVLQDAIRPYYLAGHYDGEDVSAFIRGRTRKLLDEGIPIEVICKTEVSTPWSSVTKHGAGCLLDALQFVFAAAIP